MSGSIWCAHRTLLVQFLRVFIWHLWFKSYESWFHELFCFDLSKKSYSVLHIQCLHLVDSTGGIVLVYDVQIIGKLPCDIYIFFLKSKKCLYWKNYFMQKEHKGVKKYKEEKEENKILVTKEKRTKELRLLWYARHKLVTLFLIVLPFGIDGFEQFYSKV